MAGPLEGIRILDLSWVLSGPYCSMALGDMGAEVIKVERPISGDMARGSGPFINGESSYFISLNRGKKSLTLNLAHPRGKEVFLRLVERADVVLENFVPGTMKSLGLDYEVLRACNPRLVYAAISGFGQTGPYAQRPAMDVIVQGMGGIMSVTGEPGGPPIRPGASLGDIVAGLFAAMAILAALQERERSGLGQMVDISMLDCQVALQENAFARYFATGEVPQPLGTRHPVFTPFQAFQTKDGYIVVAMVGGMSNRWPLFCSAIDRVDLIDDPRFETGWNRTQRYGELEPILSEAMRRKTTQEWLKELSNLDIPCGPVNTIDKVAADLQIAHRRMIVEVPHPRAGPVKVVNTPVRMSRTPPKVERACPDLGEHSREVLRDLLGMGEEEIEELGREGAI
ncbi:MAG: CoA transferase [Chloroflexi bacterium]|nr:CoA transferase [Chloroflexota bacterium]